MAVKCLLKRCASPNLVIQKYSFGFTTCKIKCKNVQLLLCSPCNLHKTKIMKKKRKLHLNGCNYRERTTRQLVKFCKMWNQNAKSQHTHSQTSNKLQICPNVTP